MQDHAFNIQDPSTYVTLQEDGPKSKLRSIRQQLQARHAMKLAQHFWAESMLTNTL